MEMLGRLIPKEFRDQRTRVLDLALAFNRACEDGRVPQGFQCPDIHLITYAFATALGEPLKAVSGSVLNTHRRPVVFPGKEVREGKFFWKPKKELTAVRPMMEQQGNQDIWAVEASHSWLSMSGPDKCWIQLRPHGALPDLLCPSMSRHHPDREAYEERRLDAALVPDDARVRELAAILRTLIPKK